MTLVDDTDWRTFLNSYQGQPNKNYFVQTLAQQNTVDVWSLQRLTFEPKGWLLNLRNDIRTAVGSLKRGPNDVLHTTYSSSSNDFCDIENILLYNVGVGHFSRLATRGIRFERSFIHPPPPQPLPAQQLHHHHYTSANANRGFLHWRVGQTLAQWTNIELPELTSAMKIEPIWYAIWLGPMQILHMPTQELKRFGVSVTIITPSGKTINIASLTKPLIDGLVAAFHVHDGQNVKQISQRIGDRLGVNPDTIERLLSRKERAILGRRQLVWLRSSGVQWNPADHYCLAAEVLADSHRSSQWLISGTLFEIEPL